LHPCLLATCLESIAKKKALTHYSDLMYRKK
jgi:hypothetical protein